jgi:hypothetical protein
MIKLDVRFAPRCDRLYEEIIDLDWDRSKRRSRLLWRAAGIPTEHVAAMVCGCF